MRKKLIMMFVCFVFFAQALYAQDVITKQNGDIINSKIMEVGTETVKYKKFELPNGPDYIISAEEVFMIKYEKGNKDIFEKNQATGKIQIRHVDAENGKPPVQQQQPLALEPKSTATASDNKNSELKEITDELPVPAEGETLYEGTATFPNVDVKDFKIAFLLSADNSTMYNWKIMYKELKVKANGTSVDLRSTSEKRAPVGKDTTYIDLGNTKISGLTFVNGGAKAKIWHKYVSTDYSTSRTTEVNFGTVEIFFRIIKGKGPAIVENKSVSEPQNTQSSQVKQPDNGTFEFLDFDGVSVSFRAVVETPFYMASLSSGDRTIKASSINNTKGNIRIGDGATARPGSSLLLDDNSPNLRLPKDTEVKCTFENIPAGFTPKSIVLLTNEKAAPMSYNLTTGEWVRPKQIGAAGGQSTQSAQLGEPYSAKNGEYDIVELLENNIVEAEISGNDITQVNVKIRRLVPYAVNVRIPVGSFFVSENQSAQNMVATAEKKVRLTTGGWQNISILAACANRPKDIPNSNDKFSINQSPSQAELAQLMPALNKANASTPVKQAAVWIVTDDANFDDLGILTNADNTRAIWYESTTRAMRICVEAGIDITKKKIWNDKETIVSKLSAGELKNWLKQKITNYEITNYGPETEPKPKPESKSPANKINLTPYQDPDSKKWGYKDKNGNIKISCEYTQANNFEDIGLALVSTSDGFGYIDQTGRKVIPCKYKSVYLSFLNITIGTDGQMKITEFISFKEDVVALKSGDKWGYIDKTGKTIISFLYDDVAFFSEGLASVKLNNKWGYINKTGETTVPFIYDNTNLFSEGLAAVKLNDKWGYIDKTGKTAIALGYETAHSFSEGLAAVKLNDKWGYIDKTGNLAIPLIYDEANDFTESGSAKVKLNGKEFKINKTGQEFKD
jgi:hypothetical protein